MAPAIKEYVAGAIAPLEKRLRELEDNEVKDCGVWRSDRVYGRGSLVTLKGSLWIAEEATAARPGDPDDAARTWRLAVKRGSLS